ncbi:MAG: DUF3267 domain-containing protein, partial [Infirmifilum sp.]
MARIQLESVFWYIVSFMVLLVFVALAFAALLIPRIDEHFLDMSSWRQLYALVTAILMVLVLHEGVHALVAKALGGGRVGLGVARVKWLPIGLYVRIEKPLPAWKWMLIALSPLLLSVYFLWSAMSGGWAGAVMWLAYIINTMGCSGDIVLTILVVSSGMKSLVADRGNALEIQDSNPRWWAVALLDATLAFLLSGLIVGTSSLLLAVATMKDVSLAWLPLVKLKAGSIGESRFF